MEFKDPKDRLILAVDEDSLSKVKRIVDMAMGHVGMLKFGSLTLSCCDEGVLMDMADRAGCRVFYDRKFSDSPEQIVGAARGIARRHPTVDMLSMHISAGMDTMREMVLAMEDVRFGNPVKIIGITVLPSINKNDHGMLLGVQLPTAVLQRALLAKDARLTGIVCSGEHVGMIKKRYKEDLVIVATDTRSVGWLGQDPLHPVTPEVAFRDGADYLVIDRQITDKRTTAEMRVELARIKGEVMRGLDARREMLAQQQA